MVRYKAARRARGPSALDRMVSELGANAPVTFIHGIGQGHSHIGEGSGITALGAFRTAIALHDRSTSKWEYKRGLTASVLRDDQGNAILIVKHTTLW